MDQLNVLAISTLGGAIATDVAGTFVVERAATDRSPRRWFVAAAVFLASLALFAVALEDITTGVAESLFIGLGSAVVAAHRGERISHRKATSLALLVLGVVVLQMGAGHA